MRDRFLSGLAGFVFGWLVLGLSFELLFGIHSFNTTVAFILGVVFAGLSAYYGEAVAAPVHRLIAGNRAAAARRVVVFNGRPTIKVFGREIDRPAFLDNVSNFYRRKYASYGWYTTVKEEVVAAGIRPLYRNEQNERRMFESLYESARYAMHRRGIPIVDRLNNMIGPEVHDQGLLIESVENDDGSVSHILAVDVTTSLDREEWIDADRQKIGRLQSAWDERPRELVRKWKGVEFASPRDAVFPLYHVELIELRAAPDRTADPLASPGMTMDYPAELLRG